MEENTQTLYLIQGAPTELPRTSFDPSELTPEPIEIETRGTVAYSYADHLLPGLAHMAHGIRESATELGVPVELHLALSGNRGSIVITEGRSELLAAIKDSYGQGTYAAAILNRDSISFGMALDLDIALGHAIRNNASKADSAQQLS